MLKKHEEHMKSIKDKIDLTLFDFSKVAKSKVMLGTYTLWLPSYLDTMNKMKLDKEIWKKYLQSIKNPNMITRIEFMNKIRVWKLVLR